MKNSPRWNSSTRMALLAVLTSLSGYFIWTSPIWSSTGVRYDSYALPEHGPTVQASPDVLNLQTTFAKVAKLVKPAVVSISTVRVQKIQGPTQQFFFGDPFDQFFQQFLGQPGERAPGPSRRFTPPMREFKSGGLGSGLIIDPKGLILTNDHVVHGAQQIKVTVYEPNGQTRDYKGELVGTDPESDVAVVRIHAGYALPFVALGDSSKVQVGDWSIAIGSPFGLSQTVTAGIISAERQSIEVEGKVYRDFLQTDAAINQGNSGGPLLNISGEVIGINTAIYAPTGVFSGVGFAIPINLAKAILSQLIEKGKVVRGWLGIEMTRQITPAMVKAFGLPDDKGALVNSVLKDSPAEKAGLKRGDVIRSLDGKPIESTDQLEDRVTGTPPHTTVLLGVYRNHKNISLSFKLGERPANAGMAETGNETANRGTKGQTSWMGASVSSLTPELLQNYNQPADARGVIVTDVDDGSTADEIGLTPGDVIRAVNQMPTPDTASFKEAVGKVKLAQGVVLDILRQGHPMYLSYTKS